MTREIERRFLLERLPAGLPEGTAFRQGYLALDGEVSVRVRDAGGAHAPPAWFGVEVTGRAEWGNAALAVHGRPDSG